MGTLILAVTSLLLYSIGTALQALSFRGRVHAGVAITSVIGGVALVSHGLLAWQVVHLESGYNLGLFESSAVISWLIVAMLLVLNLRKPVHNLFLGIYPLACLSILAVLINTTPPRIVADSSYGILAHITLSITAYSLLSLAAAQALLLHIQNNQLKSNYNSALIRNLPPLQTMESLLFEMVWAGVVMLTFAILTGAVFIDDLFAQHLAHKTVFSLLSLAVFVALLIGRYTKGWRGTTASRWTLAGTALLMLAYFGSKLALEFIFQL
ncbi:cytochrome C assembly family protein [Marinobacter sp. X15-166B]|uniref:cytochrome C assembly family protein n=1 Tax=Marinobacter sp. X15-166B TaxID=1897620 RepID=UPI00085CB7FB|nr:cytochrome c biogenesis protein CcsA [Marinobacter sp. X15-166B]OEY66884.1 cytochrome C assembly protein [Marinobacter sp. X15-166B]